MNWSTGAPPNGGENAVITKASALATLNINSTIQNLTLGSTDTLNMIPGVSLTINGSSINNSGSLTMNASSLQDTVLVIGGANVTLSGTGTVTMSNSTGNLIEGSGANPTFTNQQTIQGSGQIVGLGSLVNQAMINANQSSSLTIDVNTTNTGTLEATAGGTLVLGAGTVTNTGGTISANGSTLVMSIETINGGSVTLAGSSLLQLTNATIHGGSTLTNSSTGTIEIVAGTNNFLGGTVTNPAGGKIQIDNGAVLNLESTGTYSNAGRLILNASATGTAQLTITGNVTLGTGGTVSMSNSSGNTILGTSTSSTLTNQETIGGSGNIGGGQMTLVNTSTGVIVATQSAPLTIFANGGATNMGTLEAATGTLILSGTTVNNTGGTILAGTNAVTGTVQLVDNTTINGGTVALNGASLLQMTNSTIHGSSTLTNSSMGTIEIVAGSSTLGGTVTNPFGGTIKIDNAATLNLEAGTYSNSGNITLNSTGISTSLVLLGNVTLTGGGSVTMSNNSNNLIFGTTSATTLTNLGLLISGAGNIGGGQMTLVNSGASAVINANQPAQTLIVQANGGVTNTGFMEGTAGGTLELSGTVVNNAGGTISANGTGSGILMSNSTINGGTVTLTGSSSLGLQNSTVHGGTLNNSSTGSIFVELGTNTLGGTVNNPSGGVIQIDNGTVLNLEAGSYSNAGSITLNGSTAFTELVLTGNVTLTGGGTVTMSNSSNNFIFGTASTVTLTNQETIQGSGIIESLTLVNSGVIDANSGSGSAALIIQANGGITNTGVLEATNGSTLTLSGGTITNTGGNIEAIGSGSIVQLNDNVSIVKGTLTASGGGSIQCLTNCTLNGVTNSSGTTYEVNNAANTTLAGTITNKGTLMLNSSGNTTQFLISGNVTLSGTGIVSLSNNANNVISGASTGNEILTNNSTIQGSGNIGNSFMGLVNGASGKIIANQGTPLTIQVDSKGFNNKGFLTVNTGDTMIITGFANSFLNFSGSTLTGGIYSVSGTLKFDNAAIATNAANITLNGTSSAITNQFGVNALAGILLDNSSTGSFTLKGDANLTTANNTFVDAGTLTVSKGSTFTIGGTSSSNNFNETGGKVTIDGTLAVPSGAAINVTGGNVFGAGTFTGAVSMGGTGTFNVGDSGKAGLLSITGNYTQLSTASMHDSIGGTTQGSKYSELKVTGNITLAGLLSASEVSGFTPSVGQTFIVVEATGTLSGTFSDTTIGINSTEHFAISFGSGSTACGTSFSSCVILTVVSGMSAPSSSHMPIDANPVVAGAAGRAGGLQPASPKNNASSSLGRFADHNPGESQNRTASVVPARSFSPKGSANGMSRFGDHNPSQPAASAIFTPRDGWSVGSGARFSDHNQQQAVSRWVPTQQSRWVPRLKVPVANLIRMR